MTMQQQHGGAAPTADELQQRWQPRYRPRTQEGTRLSGAEAAVDRTGEEQAVCGRCERGFTFVAICINGEAYRPTECRDCRIAQELARQADVEDTEAQSRTAARLERSRNRLELLQRITGNAAEHRGMTLETFDASECGDHVLRAVREFYHDVRLAGPYEPVRGLLLAGDTGNGKTHAAIAAGVNGLLDDPKWEAEHIVFDRADELIMRIQDCYGRRSVFDEILDRRFDARLWILDDLGTEKASEDAARLLTLIFSRRALRPTIVTMNGTLEQMQEQRPELHRVMSRFGPRYFRVRMMNGRDRRFDAKATELAVTPA